MNKQYGASKLMTLTIIIFVIALLAIAIMMMPKGFKDDLSLIGQGKTSIVLVHNKNYVNSTEMMELFNKIRPDYKNKVEFLAVDIDTPIGQAFMQQHQVNAIDLVIFSPNGTKQQVINKEINEQQLRTLLN